MNRGGSDHATITISFSHPTDGGRMRHDGCGGLPGRAELLAGIEGRIVLRAG
jgi:hypothetical protein